MAGPYDDNSLATFYLLTNDNVGFINLCRQGFDPSSTDIILTCISRGNKTILDYILRHHPLFFRVVCTWLLYQDDTYKTYNMYNHAFEMIPILKKYEISCDVPGIIYMYIVHGNFPNGLFTMDKFNELHNIIPRPLLELDSYEKHVSFFDACVNMQNSTCTVEFLRYLLENYRGPSGGKKYLIRNFSTKTVLTPHEIKVILAILPYLKDDVEKYLSKPVFAPVRQLMSWDWNNRPYWTSEILTVVQTCYTLRYCDESALVLLPNELINHILQFNTIVGEL